MGKERICKATQERLVRMMVDRLAAIIVECEETNVNFEFCAKLAREMAYKEIAAQYFVDTRDREPNEGEI